MTSAAAGDRADQARLWILGVTSTLPICTGKAEVGTIGKKES